MVTATFSHTRHQVRSLLWRRTINFQGDHAMTTRKRQPSGLPKTNQVAPRPDTEVELPIRQVDPKTLAGELRRDVEEVNKAIARIEEAKTVRQHILDLEVSIRPI